MQPGCQLCFKTLRVDTGQAAVRCTSCGIYYHAVCWSLSQTCLCCQGTAAVAVNDLQPAAPPPATRAPAPIKGIPVHYVVGQRMFTPRQLGMRTLQAITGVALLGSALYLAGMLLSSRANPVANNGASQGTLSLAPPAATNTTVTGGLPSAVAVPTAAPPPETTPQPAPESVVSLPGLPQPIRVVSISASRTAPPSVDSQNNTITYDASFVTDGQFDTAWRVPGDGIGESLTLVFAQAIQLVEIRMIPGYAKIDPYDGTNRFLQNRRVRRVRLEFSDGSVQEIGLREQSALQAVPISPVVTSRMRVVILETSEPGTSLPRDFTPISEIVPIGRLVSLQP